MANDDMFLLSAKLDISKSVQKINEDIKNIQKQLNPVELSGKLSDGVINNIQNQLKEITQKQYDINIGVINTNVQTQLNQVQKQVVSDVDIIKKETDVLINEMIAKMQSLGTVDLSTFISNLKNNLGVGTKEVKEIATELYQALKLTPDNRNTIAESYTYLTDMIRNSIGNNLIVSDKNFDNRLVAQIYECATQMSTLGNTSEKAMSKVASSSKKAEQEVAKVNSATKQTTSNLIPIETQYITTFNNVADVIKLAEKEFEKFGEVTVVSNKPAFTESGLEYYKDFTIQVKSATGEVQKFKYVMQQGEDGNIFYQLQNINEADAGIQKLIASQQKYNDKIKALQTSFTSNLQKIRSSWEDLNGGKSVKSDENINNLNQQYIKVEKSIETLKNADEITMASMKANVVTQIDKLNQMVTQYHNAEKVATQLRAKGFETVKVDTGNNIDKFINSINNSKVPVQAIKTEIDNLVSSFSNLDNIEDQAGKSSALTSILNILDNAKTKFQALQELFKGSGNANWLSINSEQINKIDDMATKTAIYKNYLNNVANEWKGQQLLVGNVAKEMASLQRGITSIKNPAVLDKYVVRIQELVTNYQRLKINLDSQVESQNKIYQIQTQISKLSSTDVSNKTYLDQKLHDEEKTLQNLQMQSGTLKNIVSLEEQEAYVTQQVKKAREDATIAQNHQTDAQMAKNIKQVSDYATAIEKSIVNLNRLKNSKIFADNSNKSSVQAQIAQLDQFITKLTQMREIVGTMVTVGNTTGKVDTTAFATLVNDMTNLNSQIKIVETSAKDLQVQLKQTNGVDTQKGKIKVLVAQLEAFAVANGKAMKSNKTLTSGMTVSQEWTAMMSKLKSGADNGDIQKITSQFKAMRSEVKALGLEGGTVFQKLWADAQKFARWMGLTMVTASIAREIRGMFKTVAELDTELIDLRKTFKGTSEDLEDFYYSANDVAKQLGVTTKEVISQASSWSRLGYGTKEQIESLSKTSSIFAAISPEMDVDTATNTIVSVLKAYEKYGLKAEDALDGIASKINVLGNNFAVSNSDLAEALQRSSASMASANTDLEHTLSLIVSANEIVQNPESVGNALKTISMRIRSMNEETEEYDDTLKTISGDVYELTHGQVSIMQDANTYKDIYTILDEVSKVWGTLTDKEQATLTEKLFGKQRGNVGSAMISNFDQARKALDMMKDSAGSAEAEMEVIKDSVDYAKNELTETLTGIAQSSITRDFEKTILQSLTRVLDVLGDASSPLNGVLTTISKIFETTSKLVENLGLIPSIIAGISLSKSFKNGGLFRTVNADADKFSQKIGILHRSFADIKTDFSTLSKANGFKQNFAHIFNFASKSDIDNFNNYCKAIKQGTTRTQAFNQYIKNTPTVIRKQAIEFTKTKAELDALTKSYASGKLTQQEYNSQSGILKDKLASLTSQTQTLTFAQKAATVATNALAAAGKMILNIGFSMAISFAISGIIKLINYQKELNEKIKETAEQAKETSDEIVDLYSQYRELSRAIETDSSKKSDLTQVTDDLLEKLGYEKTAIQDLVEKYGSLDDAIKGVTLQGLQEAQSSLISGFGVAKNDLFNSKELTGYYNSIYGAGQSVSKAFKVLKNAGFAVDIDGLSGYFRTLEDTSTPDGIIKNFETIGKALKVLNNSFYSSKLADTTTTLGQFYQELKTRYDTLKTKVDAYNSAISDLNDNIAQQQILTSLMGKELPSTQEEFDKFKDSLLESAESSEEWSNKFVGGTDSAKEAIISALKNMPEFTGFFKNEIPDATNNAATAVTSLNEALTKLQELLKDIISGSSTYQSAMQKITAGTGLTAKEVNELLELDPSLFDKFVKQKDGTWTIDLEALRLSYDTIIVDGGKNAIAEEKKSYQEQFNAVSKEIENLYVQRAEKLKHINGKADLDELNALDKQIEERKKALQGAQDDLNVASFQETLLDYSDADRIRDSFDEVTKQVDSYNDSISTLKKAQETLNEGNSLSYDDMTKLIMLYPQLKNSVIETADGYTFEQSALEDVSKQAYQTRDDYIDSQIDMTKSAIEQAKLRMEEYAHEIALISSAYAYKHAVETGLFKDYASVKDSITAMEELVNILTGYKNEVKEPSSSSSKSADKSISDALQNQIDYYTTLLDAIEAVTDKQIDALEKEKDAIDSKIDALNDEKDALKDKNDEQQRELDLIEAQNNLDKAKKQKVFVYKEGEGLVQVQDEKTVKDAQKELDDVEREIKEADIDKQIEVYEKQQEVIDKQINSANAYKDTFSDMESNAKDQLAIEQAKKALGVDENGLLHIDENTVKNIRNGLAEAIYNKDVNDNKDNDKYVTVSLADYLSGLGATVTPQQFQAIANTATGNTPITAPVTNSTVNNAQSIVNNKSITLNNTFNIYDSKDSNTVIEQIKSYMNKTLRTAINSIK